MRISVHEFAEWKKTHKNFLLVDVREEYEVVICSLGGKHIPMDQVPHEFESLPEDLPIIFHCNSGKRSDAVAYHILQKFPHREIYSLEDGVQGWASNYDPDMNCSI